MMNKLILKNQICLLVKYKIIKTGQIKFILKEIINLLKNMLGKLYLNIII